MQNACLATVVLALSLLVPPSQSSSLGRLPQPPCANPMEREPVVLYEVSGGTLAGEFDYFLSVHSDGSARLSSSLGGAGMGSSQFVSVDPSEVEALRQALTSAGALLECDVPYVTSDTPLQTLTLFRAGSTRRSNTFSWFTPDGDLALIQSLLDGFIAAHFVPPPSGGGS